MKRITLYAVIMLVLTTCLVVNAAVPSMINYQGKLLKPDGTPVADGTYAMTFALYDQPTGGVALWSEVNPSVQVKKGLFSVLLGSLRHLPDNLFDGTPLYFGTTVGADPEMTPRQQIATVAFAFKAAVADTVPDGAITTVKIADGAITKSKMAPDAISDVSSTLATGWIPANEAWAYASPTTIIVPAGATSKYSVGDKIKLFQANVCKYFYVVGVTDTLLTVTGGSDFSVSSDPISMNQYSKASSPVGFPHWFNYSPVFSGYADMTVGSVAITMAKFCIINNRVCVDVACTCIPAGTARPYLSMSTPITGRNTSDGHCLGIGRTDGIILLVHSYGSATSSAYLYYPSGNYPLKPQTIDAHFDYEL